MAPPTDGAITGTMMNTIITNDITLPIARPSNRSRTMATAITRGPPQPMPCTRRPASRYSKLGAIIENTVPAR